MKVLYINTLYPPHIGGGAELVLESQARAMAARGHAVTVLTIGPEPGIVFEQRGKVSVLRAKFQNSYFHLTQARPSLYRRLLWHIKDRDNAEMAKVARDLIPQLAPDVACCHNLAGWSISIWRELQRLQVPIVQVLHDQYLLCAKSTMFRNGRNCRSQCMDCRLLRREHAAASNQVSAVVGVSQFVLQRLLDAGCFVSVPVKEVIYNVGSDRLPAPAHPLEIVPSTGITLGFIGTLAKNKGIIPLLEQFQTSGLTDARLRIAGRGNAEFIQHLRGTHQHPSIEFVGYVKPTNFFPSIDALVVPSLSNDSLPSVVFESLAYGVPVVAARRGGIPEMIADGLNGLLFEPESAGELAACLRRLNSQSGLLGQLAANCRRSAARFYDEAARTSAEEEVFAQVIARNAPREGRTAS